jgi:hypothetical protein
MVVKLPIEGEVQVRFLYAKPHSSATFSTRKSTQKGGMTTHGENRRIDK